jgi:hypothetical protein
MSVRSRITGRKRVSGKPDHSPGQGQNQERFTRMVKKTQRPLLKYRKTQPPDFQKQI